MVRMTKRRVWVTAVGVWVRYYETAAKKAAPKTTTNPKVHRTYRSNRVRRGVGRAVLRAIRVGANGRKTKTLLR